MTGELFPAIRVVLMVVGGMLVSRGHIEQADMEQLVGSLMIILPYLWGLLEREIQRRRAKEINQILGAQPARKLTIETVEKTKK